MKHFILLLLGIIIGSVIMYSININKEQKWIPVMEPTGYEYLEDSLDYVIKDIIASEKELREGKDKEVNKSLRHSMKILYKLKRFYVPMTAVRQYIYDAERLYVLEKNKLVIEKLERALQLLKKIDEIESKQLQGEVEDLYTSIDKLLLGLKHDRQSEINKFKEVGLKANLMLLKGELMMTDLKLTDFSFK